jgi:hypothetical protein
MRLMAAIAAAGLLAMSGAAEAQTFNGSLASGDATNESGKFVDTYNFEAEDGQEITVSMRSDSFDTYLIVESPNGTATENDDFGPGLSQVTLVSDRAGTWTVRATSYSSGTTGPYTVDVELGRIGESTVTEGRLDPRDEIAVKGEYFDTHVVSLDPGGEYYVELNSYGFDGYLAVRSPSGEMWRNDDAGGTSLARVGPITGADGEWTIFVTTSYEGEMGAYDLKVTRFGEAAAPGGGGPKAANR